LDQQFDVILGSEIIYQSSIHRHLLRTLKKFCQPGHTQIILSYQLRGLGEELFFTLARAYGFSIRQVPREKLDLEFRENGGYQIVVLGVPVGS